MTTETTDTQSPSPANTPLALKFTEGLGPTHWMDDRGLHVSDRWLQSDEATSDYRAAYVIPAKMTRAGVRPLYPCKTCSGTGEDSNEGDACHDCGGSGGLKAPTFGPNVALSRRTRSARMAG